MANYKIKEYRGRHNWIERRKGKPNECQVCSDTTKTMYHWANISGEYKKDINDWRRLCARCHARENHKNDLCKYGHPDTEENTKMRSSGKRDCRTCARISWSKYNLKMRVQT